MQRRAYGHFCGLWDAAQKNLDLESNSGSWVADCNNQACDTHANHEPLQLHCAEAPRYPLQMRGCWDKFIVLCACDIVNVREA